LGGGERGEKNTFHVLTMGEKKEKGGTLRRRGYYVSNSFQNTMWRKILKITHIKKEEKKGGFVQG